MRRLRPHPPDEFFNVSIDRIVHLFPDTSSRGLASPAVHVAAGGLLVAPACPFGRAYVVTDATVRLVGHPLTSVDGTRNGLVLWETDQPLRLATTWLRAPRANGGISCSLEELPMTLRG